MDVAQSWWKPFTKPAYAFLAGAYLVGTAAGMLFVSMRVLPELQVRALEADPAVVEQAVGLVAERTRLWAELHRLPVADGNGEHPAAPQQASDPATASNVANNGANAFDGLASDIQSKLQASEQRFAAFVDDRPGRLALINRLSNLEASSGWLPRSYGGFVLVLAMATGVLGGVISVAKSYLGGTDAGPTPAEYFIRPVFGAMLGFVAVLMLKSGQAILTVEASDDPLNPFPIALLGVVSGLMAKEVIASVENWGRRVFAAAPEEQVESKGQKLFTNEHAAKTAALKRINDAVAALKTMAPSVDLEHKKAFDTIASRSAEIARAAAQQAATVDAELTVALAARERAGRLAEGAEKEAALADAETAIGKVKAALGELEQRAQEAEDALAGANELTS